MNYIKSLHVEGFKKFQTLNVEFNEHMNILVGENEAGKSTILDAIKTVLNQQYRLADKSVLRDLFNAQMVEAFEANPSVKTLPRILIEVELVLDPKTKNADYFYGEVYGALKKQDEKFGIRFECKYDELLGAGMEQSILDKKIPYEYYALTWMTFANNPYQTIRKPLQFLVIDITSNATVPSFNSYNRTLFTSRYDEATRAKAKNDFRTKLVEAFDTTELPELGDNRKFGVDTKKVVLETILSVCNGIFNHTSLCQFYQGRLLLQVTIPFEEKPTSNLPGDNLRYYRQRKSLTTRQLAEQIDVVPATILMYERNKHPIPFDVANSLADALDVNADLLYDDFAVFLVTPYSEALKDIRMSIGMSQRAFAEHIGVIPSYYYKLESGHRRPSRKVYQRMVDTLSHTHPHHSLFAQHKL